MKTKEKVRHQTLSRKSPRLSFTASASIQVSDQLNSKRTTDRTREDDAWALSLHVVEQLPLKICHPSGEEDKSFRRSSRFTTNQYRTPSPKSSSRPKALPALVLAQLRRSPRFSSASSAPALTLRNGKNVGPGEEGSKKRCRKEDGEGGGRVGKEAKLGSDGRSLRRSLRLNGDENGNLNPQLLALPEPGSKSVSKSCLSEKCLRSRTVLMRVGDEKEKAVSKSCSSVNEKCLRSRIIKCASPESSENRAGRSAFSELSSVQKSSSPTEKCLRSGTVKMHVGNEKEKPEKSGKYLSSQETERSLIEFPEASETRNSLRRSSRLNQETGESPKLEMLALPEKRAPSSKKFLSSGAYGVKSSDKCLNSQGTECALIEFPKASETRNSSSHLRRSRRLNQEGAGSPKFEIRNLPAKIASSSKKCLSSGAYGVKSSEKYLISPGRGFTLIEFPGASETTNSLRRSTRLNQERGESPKVEMLALPEKSVSSSKKGLSSGAYGVKLSEKSSSSAGIVCSLIEFPKASETRNISSRLRRSTKLNQEGGEGLKFEILDSPEKSAFSCKSLSSSAYGVKLNEKCSSSSAYGVKSNEKCLIHPKIEPDKEKCDSELIGEKCLRSRKVPLRVSVDEVDEKATASIEEQHTTKNESKAKKSVKLEKKEKRIVCFIGEPIPEEEAQKKWGWRYELKGKSWKMNADEEDEFILNVNCHYAQAKVGNCVLDIGDCVFVKGEGTKKHVGRILEFFKTMEGEDYFRVQWFFRAEDTVLKDAASFHDKRRLFYSTLMNDNILDCIISKVNIVKLPPGLFLESNPVQSAAFYYDMEYCLEYSTFRNLVTETSTETNSKQPDEKLVTLTPLEVLDSLKPELALLDLYSGCGAMSTGLCVGAKLSSVNLVTKWAVDYNSSACESLKLNHPETQVRNESAEDFLELLRQWEQLCKLYVCDLERTLKCELEDPPEAEGCMTQPDMEVSFEELEVSCLVDICYGDPAETGKRGLHFKVRWKGYGPNDDTWEPIEGLSNCKERIQEFVRKGFKSKIIPLPGDVDVVCGGPPCQGISGYNRFRNFDSPLDDERNRQIVVFMDIVEFLKPKYVLMENVVDIIRFDKASLGRYALSRLVHMKYQARLGTMASGCYGLPQFRLRVFIWGAHPSEMMPPFPLPTHDVVVKYWPPPEFERNIVAYDEGQPRSLEEAIVLHESISDLPDVTNDEKREEMSYEKPPETEFQTYIRLSKDETVGILLPNDSQTKSPILYDHRPLQLSEHDYLRVCQIPQRKGANFRDLPGVIVGEDDVARRDPMKEPMILPTGRPLVPDCVLSFEQGKSRRPYARLWWDETVSTVVTFPNVRAMAVLHPEQDRRLTVRECARLQGFPDYYRFCGTIKERYCQIGNAVSIPVARALGYALGMTYKKAVGDEPLMMLPHKFSSLRPSINEVVV